jgi:triacylglycerol lipase
MGKTIKTEGYAMHKLIAPLALAAVTAVAASSAQATSKSYYICSTSGCSAAGSATVGGTSTQTRYPIVLAHGMAGFSSIGPIDYFYGIPSDLTANGSTIYVTQVASFNDFATRGTQLLTQVNTVLALTGAAKVNLIGHSQGALDTRYVAAAIPTKIASVWTVGGVNKGDAVADVVSGLLNIPGIGTITSVVATSIINAFFTFVDVFSGSAYEQNSKAALLQLTTAKMNTFNASYPQGVPTTACGNGAASVNGVAYYSWSGSSQLTNVLDLSDAALGTAGLAFMGQGNDGLVGQCQSHLGTVISDSMGENHLDEVNQILGLTNIFATDTKTVFRNNVNRMKTYGL